MKYLGVVSGGHDAAVALTSNRDILFAGHAERYSGVKNDPNVNRELLDDALSYGEPQAIVWYERPLVKLTRKLFRGQWDNFSPKAQMAELGLGHLPIHYVGHHKSHAAGGFYTSGMSHASILVCDAIGEWATISIWEADKRGMRKVWTTHYPNSLGLLYSAFTDRVGLKANEEEYILMGMAALGDPSEHKQEILNDFITPTPSPDFKLSVNVHRGIKWWRNELHTTQDYYDIAAAIQEITEDYLVQVTKWMRKTLPSNNLIISGGVALNCKANSRVAGLSGYDKIWIMPNPGDAGSSLGAIAAYTNEHLNWQGAYLGHNIEGKLDIRQVLDCLKNGEVLGIANGRAEFGPRSLGNRSLIADPRGDHVKDQVNGIKKRELFRPFAPIILEHLASEYFDMPQDTTPYMQFTAKCKRPNDFPAICHYDQTSRVQTLNRDQNPQLYELLEQFYRETGCPMLLNTSLNIKGKPLVNTREDGIAFSKHYGVKVF